MTRHQDRTFSDRGISQEVADARGYVRFERGDVDEAFNADETFAEERKFEKWRRLNGKWEKTVRVHDLARQVAYRVRRSGGYVIPLFAPPELGLGKPVARFKLDEFFQTKPHNHAVLGPYSRALHVSKPKRHDGVDVDGEHEHQKDARYMGMADVEDKRIDMHPWAADLLPDAQRFYFSIEGSFKGDAILTSILETGEAATVFSVPSVTMWRADELEAFAEKYMRDAEVIIVPDSDWFTNPLVSLQAFACREWLRRLDIRAHVAAAMPEPRRCRLHGSLRGGKRGVDDFLADGLGLGDLVVLQREISVGFREWAWKRYMEAQDAGGRAAEAVENDWAVLWFLALRATEDGLVLNPSGEIIAEYVGDIKPQAVGRIVARLVSNGALQVDTPKPLKYRDRFIRVEGRRRALNTGMGWEDSPSFIIREDLRAEEGRFQLTELNQLFTMEERPTMEGDLLMGDRTYMVVATFENGREVRRKFRALIDAYGFMSQERWRGAPSVKIVSYYPETEDTRAAITVQGSNELGIYETWDPEFERLLADVTSPRRRRLAKARATSKGDRP